MMITFQNGEIIEKDDDNSLLHEDTIDHRSY